MPYKYTYYSDDSAEQDRRQTKRRKLQHIRTTKATCLEDEDQIALIDALEDEVQKEDIIKDLKAKYKKDIANARIQLSRSQGQTQRARKTIRDAGGAEFDSLLFVGDSLPYILTFLDIFSIGRCEKACKDMKNASDPAWMRYDKLIGSPYTSPIGDTIRDRTLRFYLASEYAKRAESESERHSMESYHRVCEHEVKPNDCGYCGRMEARWQIDQKECREYIYDYSDEEEDEGDDDSCCFPDELNQTVIKEPERFDIFMRAASSKVLFEGFIPQEQVKTVTRRNGTIGLDINFRGMKFPNWPDMERSLSLDLQNDKIEWLESTSSIPRITILAMRKTLPSKIRSVKSLGPSLMGCFGHCNLKELDELDDDYLNHFDDSGDTVPTNYEGFGFEGDIYHVRVGSVTPRNVHNENGLPCRYMYLVWKKEAKSKFAGLRIEDGDEASSLSYSGYDSFNYSG